MAYEIITAGGGAVAFRASEFISAFAYTTSYIIGGVPTSINVASIKLTNKDLEPYFEVLIDPQPDTTETYTYSTPGPSPSYVVNATELQPLTKSISNNGALIRIQGIRCDTSAIAGALVSEIAAKMQQYINQ